VLKVNFLQQNLSAHSLGNRKPFEVLVSTFLELTFFVATFFITLFLVVAFFVLVFFATAFFGADFLAIGFFLETVMFFGPSVLFLEDLTVFFTKGFQLIVLNNFYPTLQFSSLTAKQCLVGLTSEAFRLAK
jgi:hypothetical protein